MLITLEIGSSQYEDVEALARSYAKESGRRVKDIGEIVLSTMSTGVAMTILDLDGKFITNVAL